MTSKPFIWRPGSNPPQLQEHSRAKLDVFRSYLRAYIDTLVVNPARDEFKLDLVDGFCGGGTFLDNGGRISGTPLIILEELHAATRRLNLNRAKPLNCDFRSHFVDIRRDHIKLLQESIRNAGFDPKDPNIVTYNGAFEHVADEIIADILRRQPRAGRAIFLLDQTGYSQVDLRLVARIFNRLRRAEVILTFAADALINFLRDSPQLAIAVAPIDLNRQQVRELVALGDENNGRALVQRVLRQNIRATTGATYDTPFFIRPKGSRRALWFLHLSRHPTARDVMIRCHWANSNQFEHYGEGGLNMLGWDALVQGPAFQQPLFNFTELDLRVMRAELLESLPEEIHALAASEPITVDAVRHEIANRTAARYSDLDEMLLELFQGGEIEILNSNGALRSRSLQRVGRTDLLAIPSMRFLPGL